MNKFLIKDNYYYLEFNNDIAMFEKLDELLNDGYVITDSVYLCVELCKNDVYYLLSYLHIEDININIKEKIKSLYKECEISYPNYNNTFLNVISAIRDNFGYKSRYRINERIFDKKYDKVIVMVLDGLGIDIINNNLPNDSFIKSHLVEEINSIYPSTTAAATTAIKSGLSPITSGWTGWENYIKEIDRNVILFTGINYYTEEPTGISLYKYIPYKMFYNDMKVNGYCIEPNFSKPNFDDVLKRSLDINKKNEKQIQYVYYTEPDSLMHEFGAYSDSVKVELSFIDKKLKTYADKLSDNTLLIITADHGHINVSPIELYKCKPLLRLLKRKPSNDSRCVTFSVLDDKHEEFELLFNSLFSSIYKLYKTEEAIKLGFFGAIDDDINPRCNDFLADYVAVGINSFYFNYKGLDNFEFKSHHAGITKNEMIVPICLVRR